MPDTRDCLLTAVRIAYRQFDQLTEAEQSAVLVSLMHVGGEQEADLANKTLFHLREQRRLQLTLRAVLDGVGGEKTGA